MKTLVLSITCLIAVASATLTPTPSRGQVLFGVPPIYLCHSPADAILFHNEGIAASDGRGRISPQRLASIAAQHNSELTQAEPFKIMARQGDVVLIGYAKPSIRIGWIIERDYNAWLDSK